MRANIAAKLSPDWLPELNEEQVVELADGGRGLLVTACCQAQKAAQLFAKASKLPCPGAGSSSAPSMRYPTTVSRSREWTITATDHEFEVAPGVTFAGWLYNGRVPGPTLRCVEGERLRIRFVNASTHPHSMHFHGIHAARMDGVPGAGLAQPGEEFVYEFDAVPFGCHLYHCHAIPLKRHIHKGLYGAFIVDPDPALHPAERAYAASRLLGAPENAAWQEMIMVMNGFDTNFDDENEFYAVNTIPFAYFKKPIRIEKSRPVRVYLVNITEFDPINSFHLHGNFFDFYDHGTTLQPTHRTIDTVMMCQAQRGILEFTFANHEPGLYMFHAHQSEFAELGWMSHFEVVEA